MIKIRKIIYWHFAVYGGDAETIDPENLPSDSISTLDMGLNEANPIIVNGAPNVRAFSVSTGYEWLIDIFVQDGQTKDLNDENKRTTIRSNNPVASPGFVWFDLAVVELKAVFGNPIVVESLEQLSLVKDDNNDGVRIPVKYMLFGAHKEGETGAQLRNEPDAFFDATNIPNEVSSEGDQGHQEFVEAISSKTFVDEDGVPNSFFINIKHQEEVTKIGCCNIDVSESSSSSSSADSSSSSSEDGASSSSSSSSTDTGSESCPSGLTLRSQPVMHDGNRRVWAVRQTADIHISNNPVYEGNFFADSGVLVRKNYIASELVYADVENVLNGNSSWNSTHWQHAGYISFRENKPYAMGLHQDPVFNKTDLSYSSGNLCAYHAYDDNFELPVTIQSITWDTRGYLWALCSGGAKDATPDSGTTVSGVQSTEGVYALIPGGWKKQPADIIYFGGSNTGNTFEYEDLNSSALVLASLHMRWGCDRSKSKDFLAIVDNDFHIHIKKNANSNINFPEEQNIRNDNGLLLLADNIYAGVEKICVVEAGTTLPYLISYSQLDTDLSSLIATERANNVRYSILACGVDFIVGVSQSSQIKVFVNSSATNVPTQDDADELQSSISTDITDGYSIKKVVCGDSFFAVYLKKTSGESKLYARGYIKDIKIWDGSNYDANFIRPQSWDLSETKPILDVEAFGDYLIIAYAEGLPSASPKSLYYEVATVLDDIPLHNTGSASSAATSKILNYEVLNQLRKIYIDNASNDVDSYITSSNINHLLPSKGLLGYRKFENVNSAYGNLFIHENSEYLHHPYFSQSGSFIPGKMEVKSGMFGYDISSFGWNGVTYLAVSAPTEGPVLSAQNGGVLGQQDGKHGRGAVYIFKRYENGFKLIQKIQHSDTSVIAFGKQVCLYATKNASDEDAMALICSYRGNTSDYTRIYYWNSVEELFEWSEMTDSFIQVNQLTLSPSTSDIKIIEIKRISDHNISVTSFVNNAIEGYVQFINLRENIANMDTCKGVYVKLTSFNSLSFGPRFGASAVKESSASGWTVAIGYTTYNSALQTSLRLNFLNFPLEDAIEIKMQDPVSPLIAQGNGAVMLLYLSEDMQSFESDVSGPIFNVIEGTGFNSNATTKPYFGYDIDADENHIVISSPYDSGYSASGESSNILEGGSVRIFEFNNPISLGSRDVNVNSEFKFNLNNLSQYHLPRQVYNLGAGTYSAQWTKKKLGKSVKLVGNKVLVSSCDDDLRRGPSTQSNLFGNVFLLDKNSKGSWDIVSSSHEAHNGDRFGHKIEILPLNILSNGKDFIALVSSPGMVTSAVQLEDCLTCNPADTDYSYGSGVVKSIVVSGDKSFGVLPSRIPSVLQNIDSDNTSTYTLSSSALGIKHVAHDISNGPLNSRYVWKYYPARLLERSAIQSGVNDNEIPKFRLAKFINDPSPTGETDFASTYSDVGAFSMISDTGGGTAGDITVANLPIYDRANLNIRVMEMHPRPYRIVDASMSSSLDEASTSVSLPKQIRSDYFDFATPAKNELQETIYLYGPILSPQQGAQWSGSISPSNSFGITPVRASRWLIPVADSDVSNILYINGIAVWSPTVSNVEYNIAGGYYFNSSSFLRPSGQQVHTNMTGNPLVKPFNGTVDTSRWWSTRNYISPGCVQLLDSSTEGHLTVWPAFNFARTFTSSGNPNPPPFGGAIQGFLDTKNFYIGKADIRPGVTSVDASRIDACKIDKAYFWGLKIAEGSYNVFINAYLNATSVNPFRIHQTTKYLAWSGCTVALERSSPAASQLEYGTSYTGYAPSYESYDFNLGHILSYPPINFRCTTGNVAPKNSTVVNNVSTISAISNAPNGSTHALYLDAVGWNSSLMNVGVKDIVIHGHYNYHGFNKSASESLPVAAIADRRSQIVTFISGYGSKISSINGRNSGSCFFAPSIKFTCILDSGLSSYRRWKQNFGGLTDWNHNGGAYSGWGKIAKNPTFFANSFTNNPSWVTESGLPNGFNARVAPTDTMYMVDLFWDYDPNATTPSPEDLKTAIFNSSFNSTQDIYSNLLLPVKVSGNLSQSQVNLFPLRAYPLNRNQINFSSCGTTCPAILVFGIAVSGYPATQFPPVIEPTTTSPYTDTRSAHFGYSSNNVQCANGISVKYDRQYTNIVACKTFTDGFGVTIGGVAAEAGTHLASTITSIGTNWCGTGGNTSTNVATYSYKYKTILYPSITSIDSHTPSSGFNTHSTYFTGGGPSLLQWHSHFAPSFIETNIGNGPLSFGAINEFAPYYDDFANSTTGWNTPRSGHNIMFWVRHKYNASTVATLSDVFPAKINDLVGSFSGSIYPKLRKESAFKYPYKTNMLTGRGRNVQISALGSELRSIGRDEIVYQNEFIYRKLSYHRQNSSGTVVNSQFSPVHEFNSVEINSSGTYTNNQSFVNDISSIVPLLYSARSILENDPLKPHIREEYQTETVSNVRYRRASLFDRVTPQDFFTNPETLVCLPTFSMPDMLDFATSDNSFSHIFGILNNFADSYGPNYPDSANLKYIGMLKNTLSTNDKNNLGYSSSSPTASAFWKAIKNGLAHIIDVNSSVMSLSNGEDLLTVTILASLNGNVWTGSNPIKHSFGWQNSILSEEIYGGGLICAVITAKVTNNGGIANVRSTFANSAATLSSSSVKARVSAVLDGNTVPEKSWCRMGIWMQPLLGTAKPTKDNSPYYWPGNFPWSGSSDIKYLGINPGDQAVSQTKFFHTSPGMIKVPINRSYLAKLGKHIMLKYNTGSEQDRYFAIIGPCVYHIQDALSLDNGPLWWANERKSSCFKMPSYSWDSRPVVFQKFGLSVAEISSASSYSDLFKFSAYTGQVPRMVKSFFNLESFTSDFGANNTAEFAAYGSVGGGAGSLFAPNEQWFDYGSETYGFAPSGANDAVAILGEGIGFNIREGNKIHAFVFWRNAFYRITPPLSSATESHPVITEIPINTTYVQNGETIIIKDQLKAAYELHRLNGFFNGNTSFVVSGNAGNDNDNAFTYVFKFVSNGTTANGFSGPGMVYEARVGDIGATAINDLCNQAFRYQLWMSSDASILAIGNHRWDAQSDQISPNGDPLPSTFYIDLYRRNVTGSGISYVKLLEQGLKPSDSSEGRPVDVFCSSLWGVQSSTNASLYDIYVASGIDPDVNDANYLAPTSANYSASNFENRIGRVTVFTASVPTGGQASRRSIELSDIVPATDPAFNDNNKAFANLNFWTMTPISAKNGSCGLMFHQNTLIASSLGCLIKMSPKSPYHGSGWQISKIVGANSPMPSIPVKRAITPYSQFGYVNNNPNGNFEYAINADIMNMSTIAVPTINSSASAGFNKLASKIAFIEIDVDNNPYSKIFSISNYTSIVSGSSADVDQLGVFDASTELSNPVCYPAYTAIKSKRSGYSAGQSSPETQIYNPSIKAWLYAYDLGNSLGDSELPYSSYEYSKDNEGHILVKPPVPDLEKKQFYFGGNEFLTLDGNNVYRDYHGLIGNIKGTLLQMDWQDVSGILWWGTNDIYIMRSYKYDQHYSPSASDILLEEYVRSRTYYADENTGITSVNKNAIVKFAMPSNANTIVQNPTCDVNDYMGTLGCGLTGPKVITVAASTNYGLYDVLHNGITSIIPLMQSREKFGKQKTVIILDDFPDHMNSQIFTDIGTNYANIMPFYSYSSSNTVNPYRVYAEDMFIDSSMRLIYRKSDLLPSISKYQNGFSIPNISVNNCEGPIVFARKSIYSSANTKWSYMIKDLSSCFDPLYGTIYNGDNILLTRLSYMYPNSVSSSHPEADWYFAPISETVSNADVPTYTPSMSKCLCVGLLRASSRKIAKWKLNSSSGGSSLSLLDIITVQTGDQSPARIRTRIDTSSSGASTIKDLVLCGKINTDIINAALSKSGATDIPNLMTKIKDNLYSVIGGQSFMDANGCIHIVDTDSEAKIDNTKEEFIREFMNKFNGFYHVIRGA
jgi:hypothetical protein